VNHDDLNDPDLHHADHVIAELLADTRPSPPSPFRGALARQLVEQDPGWGPRPDRLWPRASALIAVGALLLLVGALFSTGGI
jgi:hypothetical protein